MVYDNMHKFIAQVWTEQLEEERRNKIQFLFFFFHRFTTAFIIKYDALGC